MSTVQDFFSSIPPELLAAAQKVAERHSEPKTRQQVFETALENAKFYSEKVLPAVLASEAITIADVVTLLTDHCLLEKNLNDGFEYFNKQLVERGLEIEMDQKSFVRMVDQLSNLRLYRQFIWAMGLGSFEDEIMATQIKKIEPFPELQSKVMEAMQSKKEARRSQPITPSATPERKGTVDEK